MLLLPLVWLQSEAQTLKGFVYEKNSSGGNIPLQGVNIHWAGTTSATSTDSTGHFSIVTPGVMPAKIVVSYVGYRTDSIWINSGMTDISVRLHAEISLSGVTVEEKKMTTTYSTLDPMNNQFISSNELKKTACCNL